MDQFPILRNLLSNNTKWAAAVSAADPNFFPCSAANPQRPKVLWIGCSDSRVPENTLFAAMPGDIFSTRNIANQAHLHDDSVISVITYALSEAVGVQHIVIAGHTGCGGAKASLNAAHAAIDKDPSNPTVPCGTPLERWLAPLTKRAIELLQEGSPLPDAASNSSSSSSSGNSDCEGLTADELAIENVRLGIESVLKSGPVQEAWKCSGSLQGVHGVLYHLNTGIVEDLKLSVIHPHH